MISMIRPILKVIKLILALGLLYLAIFSYRRYERTTLQDQQVGLSYSQYNLDLYPEFFQQTFDDFTTNQKLLQFDTSKQKKALIVNGIEIPYRNLEIEHEDALHIDSVVGIEGEEGCYKISSRFFTLVYCADKQSVCYQKIGVAERKEYYFADRNKDIWIFTHPNNNILILRVYECVVGGQMKKSERIVAEDKIQGLSWIRFGRENSIQVSALTFERNKVVYEFDEKYSLKSTTKKITHEIKALEKQITDFSTKINQQITIDKFYNTMLDMLYEVSGGRFGRLEMAPYRQIERDYDIEALDSKNNIILEFNRTANRNSLISLSDYLLPFRTPVFISKENYLKMKPIQDALNNSKEAKSKEGIDFKVYEIRTKTIKEMNNQIGVYRIIPDASIHFVSFDPQFLTLYPQENINKDEYYTVRSTTGGIVLKGTKMQGMFSEQPLSSSSSINYGVGEGETYHQLTTNAKEMMPGIYECHIIHKSLFTYDKKNRMQLITSMTGKSVLTYYYHNKQGYTYSTSFIENNQFWVFEHHNTSAPLVTKYQLFVNASTPKSVLSIKRNYELPITGRIIKVQKCIDGFYYFDYVNTEGKYGIARAHHAIMSNRQPHPQKKQAGAFEKMMIIKDLERNTKLKISSEEQKILTLQMSINPQIVDHTNELQLKHQYSVLPYRVYSDGEIYYLFNIRKLLIQAYDGEIKKVQRQTYFTNTLVLGIFSLFALVVAILGKSHPAKQKLTAPKDEKPKKQSKKD